MTAPSSPSVAETVLLPEPIPPVSPIVSMCCIYLLPYQLAALGHEGRHHLPVLSNDAVAGDLKDVGIGVSVDGHDVFGCAHARDVLAGARNSHGDVELGAHPLARQAHLIPGRSVPSVAASLGRSGRASQQRRGYLDDCFILRVRADTPATTDHYLRVAQHDSPAGLPL